MNSASENQTFQDHEEIEPDIEHEYIPGSDEHVGTDQTIADSPLNIMLKSLVSSLDDNTQATILSVAEPLCRKISDAPVSSTLKWGGAACLLSGVALDYASMKMRK